jgi:putative colanic acid biosynthesis acetyltransferase WcaF
MKRQIDITNYHDPFTLKNRITRLVWNICYLFLFRPFSLRIFRSWRSFLLRVFGAKIGNHCLIHASVKIWAPWNLEIDSFSVIGSKVDCYNQGKICIGSQTIISQKSYLCASTHDFTQSDFPLIYKPIVIEDQVWIAADAFVGPGVTIGQGAVVGARSAVFKNVEPWTVVGGNPAKFIKKREIK